MNSRPFSEPELLAPAGDLRRAETAIRYGADAVYLGGQKFSLRSRASNFSIDEIAEAVRYANQYHARIHVTVNEIPHDSDFDGLEEYLKTLEDIGVTAIIAASPAIMKLAKQTAPKLEVHCSTQMSVTNASTAQFLKDQLDIDRVVLARECTLEEVRAIVSHCPVDTEAFIHGGMCVNYSGRCTLSNRMTLRDANRGGCAQSCRWSYHLFQNGKELSDPDHLYTMGSKDLCAVNEIAELMKAGVRSFKIEGRMKTEFYVAGIVSAYRHLMDELIAHDYVLSEERMAYHAEEILKAENRETCPGFYEGIDSATVIMHENSDKDVNHGFLGRVVSYDENAGVLVLETRNPIDLEDRIEVMEPGMENRTFTVKSMQNENGEYLEKSRVPMRLLKIPVPFAVKIDDLLRKA